MDDNKFDEFLGNDSGVLAGNAVYDDEDREADNVWDGVEDRMDGRRKVRAQRAQRGPSGGSLPWEAGVQGRE